MTDKARGTKTLIAMLCCALALPLFPFFLIFAGVIFGDLRIPSGSLSSDRAALLAAILLSASMYLLGALRLTIFLLWPKKDEVESRSLAISVMVVPFAIVAILALLLLLLWLNMKRHIMS